MQLSSASTPLGEDFWIFLDLPELGDFGAVEGIFGSQSQIVPFAAQDVETYLEHVSCSQSVRQNGLAIQNSLDRMKLRDAAVTLQIGGALESTLLNALYYGNLELGEEARGTDRVALARIRSQLSNVTCGSLL